jgi:hypothetical protein
MSDGATAAPLTPAGRRALAAGLGLLALLLAGFGERVIRSGNQSGLGLGLYLASIALFAWGAWPLPPAPSAVLPSPSRRGLRWVLLLSGFATAVALTAFVGRSVWREKLAAAEAPWAAAVALVLAASLAGGSVTAFPARWDGAPRESNIRKKWLFRLAVAGLLALAVWTRLPGLDHIPLGINADEGDQAAVSIQLIRGTRADSLFGVGWYHISMMYFHALAAVMRVFGVSVGGARVFGAFCGIATAALVIGMATRHFGRRAGLLAGAMAVSLGPAIQFSRETTCAGPTIALWTASAELFLEAARTGRAWAWAGAGLCGGFSIYFYPTGRLWGVAAALFTLGLIARGPKGMRGRLVVGTALAAIAALVIMAPFLSDAVHRPDWFLVRARETSVFVKGNPNRLNYYDPRWTTAQLVKAQLEHSVGIFNRYPDGNFFWPTGKPILPPALAALTLVGLGASALKARDPRLLMLSAWFWVGFIGVVVTVETPNLHRMATAVPVLALFSGLVLDDLARRLGGLAPPEPRRLAVWATGAAAAVAGLAALVLAGNELRFYFGPYAKSDAWPYPRAEGEGMAKLGPGTWTFSLGRDFHMTSSGWVTLFAPDVPRGGILTPGDFLPVVLPPNHDLAFVIYARQPYYKPLLREIYPGGFLERVTHPPDVPVYDIYRIPRRVWAEQRGALAQVPGKAAMRVATLGEPPPGATGPMRWTASLRAPRFWNYGFRAGPGPARLVIDGRTVLDVPRGKESGEAVVHLARGDHHVVFEGIAGPRAAAPLLRWAVADETAEIGSAARWEGVPSSRLFADASPPGGLFGRLMMEGRPELRRLDRALASGGLAEEIPYGLPFNAVWTGRLLAPEAGTYRMIFAAQGDLELVLDGRTVLKRGPDGEDDVSADVGLEKGTHDVEIRYRARRMPGFLDWRWRPPSGIEAIVPPSALRPPPGAGVGPAEPLSVLGPADRQPRERPIWLRW